MNGTDQATLTCQLLLALLQSPVQPERLAQLVKQGPNWDILHEQAQRHEILPLVYLGLRQISDQTPPEILSRYQSVYAANVLRNLQLKKELQRLVGLLLEAGIPVVPFKGPTLAEAAYGDLAQRSFRDLDLLVPPEQGFKAITLLQDHGYQLEFDLDKARWPSLARTVNHLFQFDPIRKWGVEIHWMVFHPMYLLPFDLAYLWRKLGSKNRVLCGELSVEDNLVILCAHGTKHSWENLKWIVDIQRLIASKSPIDWHQVWELATATGCTRSVLLGLTLAARIEQLNLPESVIEKIRSDLKVTRLGDDVWKRLFRNNPERRQFFWEYSFQLRSRDRFTDRWRQVIRWLFYPRLADWLVFPAGDKCFALFYLQRPIRMTNKWIVKPLCRRFRNNGSVL